MNGQHYVISNPVATADITVNTTGSPIDLAALTASAAVPFYLEYFQANSGVNAAQIQKGTPVLRSTPGSGAAGSLGIRNLSPAGPAASTTCNYLVGTLGSLSGTPFWSEDWQQFGGMELDRREDGYLVPSSTTFAFELPSVAAQFSCNINATILEVK